ncbi:MAG: ABC transporter ATP-binding protein [Chloroflexi bacterium]|nr:ABC transporter ATP-binding protein [Chloroflexota bacterium]
MSRLIETDKLTKQFEALLAVDHLTLAVEEGEILALLGPNGAGKTTTVRMLSSILKPTGGSARIAGLDVVKDARHVRHLVGHLTEFPGLYLRMRALDYLDFFGELQGMARADRQARAEELLEHFGLWDARERRLAGYSKGMRQKVALIRAMLHNPRVLFLDEPTSAMDPQSAKQVRDAIQNLRGSGHTIILCTHNLHEAETLADRIAVIRRGRLIALGTPDELKRELLGPALWEVRLARPLDHAWPQMNGHLQIQAQDEFSLRYHAAAPEIANPLLLDQLHQLNAQVLALTELPRSLETVYLKLVEDSVPGPNAQVPSHDL